MERHLSTGTALLANLLSLHRDHTHILYNQSLIKKRNAFISLEKSSEIHPSTDEKQEQPENS